MVAAFAAIRKRLCIISGGPGTGKTRTVVLLLALLLEQADNANLRIALAAPTGKAAARLQEAVKNAKAALPCSQEIKDRLPEEASTIHRLLRSIPDSPYFRHNVGNPLPVNTIIVDEASMVDLALMAKLVAAIPPSARLILLGDQGPTRFRGSGRGAGGYMQCRRVARLLQGIHRTVWQDYGREAPARSRLDRTVGAGRLHSRTAEELPLRR
jgi:ATP-dependent exoDNAse (exonuclease V) alpha subunit